MQVNFAEVCIFSFSAMPKEIKEMSLHDRENFLKAAQSGTKPRYYIRIMIVGEQSVGKTCLLRRLMNEGIDDVVSTDGINIEVRKCQVSLADGRWFFFRGLFFIYFFFDK